MLNKTNNSMQNTGITVQVTPWGSHLALSSQNQSSQSHLFPRGPLLKVVALECQVGQQRETLVEYLNIYSHRTLEQRPRANNHNPSHSRGSK